MTAMSDLSSHTFLVGLTQDALARLSTCASVNEFQAGTRVFSEGGRADRFWLIIDGHVTLDAYVPGRGTVVIETLGAGMVLGWSWMFPPYVWHFGATSAQLTRTVEFDGTAVGAMCEQDSALGYELTRRFMQVVIDRLQATRIRLLDLYRLP